MRFDSDRQRKAVFANLNRFSDEPRGKKTAVVVGGFKDPYAVANSFVWDPLVKNVAILASNTKGLSEIYVEGKDDKITEIVARSVQMTPAPVRGILLDSPFDETLNDPMFVMMGGKKIERDLSDVELPSDVYSESPNSKEKKRPQSIGSKWKGEKYIHGPRLRLPKDFIFMKTVEPEEKYRHIEDGDKIPHHLAEGSKLVIGKLREGDWAVQSILTPR